MEWREFFEIYPFTQDRQDARAALIAQTIWNTAGRTVKDNHLRTVQDFMPKNIFNDTGSTQRSVEQQEQEELAFANKLLMLQLEAKNA